MNIKYKITLVQVLILEFMTGEVIEQPHVNEEYSFVKKFKSVLERYPTEIFEKGVLRQLPSTKENIYLEEST
jgi:hypothetical protein